jgi:hypothetical protein
MVVKNGVTIVGLVSRFEHTSLFYPGMGFKFCFILYQAGTNMSWVPF